MVSVSTALASPRAVARTPRPRHQGVDGAFHGQLIAAAEQATRPIPSDASGKSFIGGNSREGSSMPIMAVKRSGY